MKYKLNMRTLSLGLVSTLDSWKIGYEVNLGFDNDLSNIMSLLGLEEKVETRDCP